MRIVIDMQGAQSGSRLRGIGRYTVSLAKAIVRNCGQDEVLLALSGLFPDTLDSLFAEFDGLLPKENIRVWHALGPVKECEPVNRYRREVAEKMREAFLSELQPDVVLVCSLFEGLYDDAINSIGRLGESYPTVVILYDLIPLINPDKYFRASKVDQEWYFRKISSLKRSRVLLAISESSRQEALSALDFEPESIVTISGAYDGYFESSDQAKSDKETVWARLGISKPFVMYIGGADERKNLDRLIMAYGQLPQEVRHEHQLVFAGDMPDFRIEHYSKVAHDCGLADEELIFTGYIEDSEVLTLYNTCSLFVMPSLHEGFGIPPLEAMACGAPVIGADATSLTEVIGLKEALFDPYSVRAISSKMEHTLTNECFRARLIEHGQKHCRRFSWDESAKRALQALRRFDPKYQAPISSLLNIEKTSRFAPRQIKLLAIKLDHLGDFLLAVPAFAKLKAKYPYATIDLVVGSWNVPVAEKLGLFDRIFTYDFFKRKSSEPSSIDEKSLEELLRTLDKYDIAIDFRRQPDGRFLLTKAKAQLKVAYQTFDKEIDEAIDVVLKAYKDFPSKANLFNKTSISCQMLSLVDALPVDVNDFITFPSICRNTARVPWTVAIFPKAGNDAREWCLPNFSNLVGMLLANQSIRGINVYFANQAQASEFRYERDDKLRVHVGLEFQELAESLSSNDVCIANNSGGGHLASYLGVTSLVIFSGHELPSEWGPQFNYGYDIRHAAPCAPCHTHRLGCPSEHFCLTEILVEDIYTITIQALKKRSSDNMSEISLQNSTDVIVNELIDSITNELIHFDDQDKVRISELISKNHSAYPIHFEMTYISPGVEISHKSISLDWIGFSGSESQFRWSDGHTAEIRFSCPEDIPPSAVLSLKFDTFGRQHIMAIFNGVQVYDRTHEGADIELNIPVSNMKNEKNRLVFSLPDARFPGNGDGRRVGLAMKSLRIDINE